MPYKSQTYVDLENINHTLIHRHYLNNYDYALNAKEVLEQHSQHYKPATLRLLKHSILIRNKVAHFMPVTKHEHRSIAKLLILIKEQHSEDSQPQCKQTHHHQSQA